MSNFRIYPGMFLKADEDKSYEIKKGDVVQLISTGMAFHPFFTFVGKHGMYEKTGKGWTPVAAIKQELKNE